MVDEWISGGMFLFWNILLPFWKLFIIFRIIFGNFPGRFFKDIPLSSFMNHYWTLLKKHRFAYVFVLSFVTTVMVINATTDFAEKLIRNPSLFIVSSLLFILLLSIAVWWRLWNENEYYWEAWACIRTDELSDNYLYAVDYCWEISWLVVRCCGNMLSKENLNAWSIILLVAFIVLIVGKYLGWW